MGFNEIDGLHNRYIRVNDVHCTGINWANKEVRIFSRFFILPELELLPCYVVHFDFVLIIAFLFVFLFIPIAWYAQARTKERDLKGGESRIRTNNFINSTHRQSNTSSTFREPNDNHSRCDMCQEILAFYCKN